MITWYRTADVALGRFSKALAFAHEVAAYVKKKTGVELGVGVPIGGNPNRIGWSAQYENLAALEATMAKLMSDPKYLEMVAKGADNFIAGSAFDAMWRKV
jgi:hypothetical protein